MPSLAGPSLAAADCDVPVVIGGRRGFVQRPSGVDSYVNRLFAAESDDDCDGDPGPDAFALLDAELALRDAVGQRARTDAYHRRDTVRAHFRLPRL